MKLNSAATASQEPGVINTMKVLLIGNNPIELGKLYDGLKSLKHQFHLETSFTSDDALTKISNTAPNCIVIDDNIGNSTIKSIIKNIQLLGKEAASITLLKTKNVEGVTSGIQEFLLKDSLTPEHLYKALQNASRFHKTQQYLKIKY